MNSESPRASVAVANCTCLDGFSQNEVGGICFDSASCPLGTVCLHLCAAAGIIKSFCAPPCFVTILKASLELLPLPFQQQQQLRHLPSAASIQATPPPRHSKGQEMADATAMSSAIAGGGERQKVRETSAIFAVFKFTVANSTARATLRDLVSFVNAGENGLWGSLRELGLGGIEGVMFNHPNGSPKLMAKPATPQDPGGLFRKVPYQCSEGNSYMSHATKQVQTQESSLCCGNRTQVCYPQGRPEKAKCYVSNRRQFQCLPARTPFEPEYVTGVPYDERVHLYWQPPADHGGHNITGYIVERVPFQATQSLTFHTPERTSSEAKWCAMGLTNYMPWYFRVSALNILGAGPSSKHSAAYTPWVLPPNEPTNVRAETGNRRVFLTWDPPAYNGGRPMESFLIEIAHDRYSRFHCADPHGCVDDILAHQLLPGHLGHAGLWARNDDPMPSEDALEWGLINAEPLSPDCLRSPVRDAECPSLLIMPANPASAGVRLKNGSHSPSGEYQISELVPQSNDHEMSAFVADPPAEWMQGMCVSARGLTVPGKVRLSAALSGADDAALQVQCDTLCMAHQIPADWRDRPQYVSGWKRGCELVVGEGWSTAGCYLHSSPLVKIANGAALRYCKVLHVWSADRRRQMPSALSTPLAASGASAASVAGKALHVEQVSGQRQSGTALAAPAPFASMLPGTSSAASASEIRAAGAAWHGAEDSSLVSARGAALRRRAAEAPVCLLPPAPVLANTVEVMRDAQGNALMNNYRYHFRVRAYNGFQPSVVSANLTVHPVGSVAKGASPETQPLSRFRLLRPPARPYRVSRPCRRYSVSRRCRRRGHVRLAN
jgi:hypothetical protein